MSNFGYRQRRGYFPSQPSNDFIPFGMNGQMYREDRPSFEQFNYFSETPRFSNDYFDHNFIEPRPRTDPSMHHNNFGAQQQQQSHTFTQSVHVVSQSQSHYQYVSSPLIPRPPQQQDQNEINPYYTPNIIEHDDSHLEYQRTMRAIDDMNEREIMARQREEHLDMEIRRQQQKRKKNLKEKNKPWIKEPPKKKLNVQVPKDQEKTKEKQREKEKETNKSKEKTSEKEQTKPQEIPKANSTLNSSSVSLDRDWLIRNGDKVPVNVKQKDDALINLALGGKTTLESQLKVCQKPIVGLNYVIEFIDPDAEADVRIYHCQLCSVFRSAVTVLEHITSYNHRVRTLRKKYPNETNIFLLPNKKTILRTSNLISTAAKKAADLESVFGRGEIQVRNERAKFPDSNILNKPDDGQVNDDNSQLKILNESVNNLKDIQIETHEECRLAKIILDKLSSTVAEFEIKNFQVCNYIRTSSSLGDTSTDAIPANSHKNDSIVNQNISRVDN